MQKKIFFFIIFSFFITSINYAQSFDISEVSISQTEYFLKNGKYEQSKIDNYNRIDVYETPNREWGYSVIVDNYDGTFNVYSSGPEANYRDGLYEKN